MLTMKNPFNVVSMIMLFLVVTGPDVSRAFHPAVTTTSTPIGSRILLSRGKFGIGHDTNNNSQRIIRTVAYASRRTIVLEREAARGPYHYEAAHYDPLNLASQHDEGHQPHLATCRPSSSSSSSNSNKRGNNSIFMASSVALAPLLLGNEQAIAAEGSVISKDIMNPASFQPVCPASDNFYRFLQGSIEAIVGTDKFIEYGPLIAGGLLRVRLELCVVESFFNEAVGPFIRENGVSWILPLHETVETFLAGSIFALATTFILVGSTKLLTVITTYFDLLVGIPSRTFGGFFYDRALGRPVTLDIGIGPFKTRLLGPTQEVIDNTPKSEELVDLSSPFTLLIVLTSGTIQLVGRISGFVREFLEAIDLFVGRYLVFFATFYIGIKFLHFKVFPDFP